jgi:hypothetical protein
MKMISDKNTFVLLESIKEIIHIVTNQLKFAWHQSSECPNPNTNFERTEIQKKTTSKFDELMRGNSKDKS